MREGAGLVTQLPLMIRLSLALFVSLLAAGPPTTDPMPRTIAERTAQALATASSPTGTAALLRLDELREYVNDANPLERTLAQVARSPHGQAVAYPVVRTVQTDGICTEVLAPAPGLTDDEIVGHRALAQAGVEVTAQEVPATRAVPLAELR